MIFFIYNTYSKIMINILLFILLIVIAILIVINILNVNVYPTINKSFFKLKQNNLKKGGSPFALLELNKFDLTEEELTSVITHIYRCDYLRMTYGNSYNIKKMNARIEDFISGCMQIAKFINENEIVNVIAPGDSPSKIIKYIQIKNLCESCTFYSFAASDLGFAGSTIEYLKKVLPKNNLEKTIIIDYIVSGRSIFEILDAYREMEHLQFADSIERQFRTRNDVEPLNIISINNYFKDSIGFLTYAESSKTRCLPKKTNYVDDDQTIFNSNGCSFFIYFAILYDNFKLAINDIISNILKNNTIHIKEFIKQSKNNLINLHIYDNNGSIIYLKNIIVNVKYDIATVSSVSDNDVNSPSDDVTFVNSLTDDEEDKESVHGSIIGKEDIHETEEDIHETEDDSNYTNVYIYFTNANNEEEHIYYCKIMDFPQIEIISHNPIIDKYNQTHNTIIDKYNQKNPNNQFYNEYIQFF